MLVARKERIRHLIGVHLADNVSPDTLAARMERFEEVEVNTVLEEFWPALAPFSVRPLDICHEIPNSQGETVTVIEVLLAHYRFGQREQNQNEHTLRVDALIGSKRIETVAANVETAIIFALTYLNDPEPDVERAKTLANHYAVGAGIISSGWIG